MALYEYQCDDCKSTFTVIQAISLHEKAKKQPECPECGSRHTHQLPSSFFVKTSSKT
jgi:putative FmdB family regulatory protein